MTDWSLGEALRWLKTRAAARCDYRHISWSIDDVMAVRTVESHLRKLDAEKLVAWLREGADELENAHRVLDDEGVPRAGDAQYTLAARIHLLAASKFSPDDR